MNTTSLPTKAAAQQAGRAAITLYRAGFHLEAAIVWRAALSTWGSL